MDVRPVWRHLLLFVVSHRWATVVTTVHTATANRFRKPGVTLAYQGTELLERTTLRLGNGRRYGLVGANGVGKTTLLRRIAAGAVPGWPLHMRSYFVQQEELARFLFFIDFFWSSRRDSSCLVILTVFLVLPCTTVHVRHVHRFHVQPCSYLAAEPINQLFLPTHVGPSPRCP